MNAFSTLTAIALSLFAVGAAQAQEATYELPLPIVSATSRADVMNELQQARVAGYAAPSEANYPAPTLNNAGRARAEVQAETLAALASGELQALNGEPQGFSGNVQTRGKVMMRMHMAHTMK